MRVRGQVRGWTIAPSIDLHGSTIISCGLGEDASFDIEFASLFNAKVIIVDPTPRAIVHYTNIIERLGLHRSTGYLPGGNQPVESYDLSKLKDTSLTLVPSALWTEATRLKFYSPPNPTHVSHSISNWQNNYSDETPRIEVDTVTLAELCDRFSLSSLPLLKLDIEGAEVEVIEQFLDRRSLQIRQIAVEFDEIDCGDAGRQRFETTDAKLRSAGYECVSIDDGRNFLYILQ